MDALKDFPDVNNVKLETALGRAFHQKTDIFRRTMFFSYTSEPDKFIALTIERVKEIMAMNAEGSKPDDLLVKAAVPKITERKLDYENVVGQDSVTRFDKAKKKKFKNKKRNPNKPQNAGAGNAPKPNAEAAPNQGAPKAANAGNPPKQGNTGAPKSNNNRNRQNRNRNKPNNPNNKPADPKS